MPMLLWLSTTASCMLASGPEEGPTRGRGSSHAQVETSMIERELHVRQIQAVLWPKARGRAYVAPSRERRAKIQALLEVALAFALGQADEPQLLERLAPSGLLLQRWKIEGHSYLAVLEGPELRGSVGAFVVRMGPASESERLLQAPHAYFDLGTGRLALEMFLAEPRGFRGLFTNTMHRHMQADGQKNHREFDPADVCHNDAHAFVAATMGAVELLGGVEVIQLHGFSDDHVFSERPGTRAIVSAGTRGGGVARVTTVAEELGRGLGESVARYPEDVSELGGTANVIGRRLRTRSGASFLHIELSQALRREIRRDSGKLARFAAAIVDDPRGETAPPR